MPTPTATVRFIRLLVLLSFIATNCLSTRCAAIPARVKPRISATDRLPIADSTALQRLRAWAEALQHSSLAQNGTVALSVRRVSDGQCVFGQNESVSLATASTLKLVTTATALATLGSTYSYTTTLEYDGIIRDSTLEGNLYLRGTGDPSLGSGRFLGYPAWAAFLKAVSATVRQAGIRRVSGSVIGDASFYDDMPAPDTWPYGDLGNYYGAGLYGLNVNENLYRVAFKTDPTVGTPAPISRIDPAMPYLSFTNHVLTDQPTTGDEVMIYGAPFQNAVVLEGTVPANSPEFIVKGAMPDPAYFVAYALTEQFRRDSIRVTGAPVSFRVGTTPTGIVSAGVGNDVPGGGLAGTLPESKPLHRTELTRYLSPPLSDLVRETNFQSINLYAEALMRSAARQLTLQPPALPARTWSASLSAVAGFWQSKGVDLTGFRPRDGSGLSTVGAMTTDNLTGILVAMNREATYPAFYASIPVVGRTGTVKNLAKNTKAAGNVRAKSGTIEGVKAFAGYFTATDGSLMCFSVIVNKYAEGQQRAVTSQLEKLFGLLVAL